MQDGDAQKAQFRFKSRNSPTWSPTLTRTDPVLLRISDPLGAHRFVLCGAEARATST